MANPDPQEFGRNVLWHLSGLRAEMRTMLHVFSRSIEPDIEKANSIYKAWIKEILVTQQNLYNEALETVGIPKSKGSDQPPTDDLRG